MGGYKKEHLKDCHGYYSRGKIVLSDELKKYEIPSIRSTLLHEKFHKWVDEQSIIMDGRLEEFAAEMWSIYNSKNKELSYGDVLIKKMLHKRYKKMTETMLLDKLQEIKALLK